MKLNDSRKMFGYAVLVAAVALTSGCFERTIFPAQPLSADGEFLFVEDIQDVLDDPNMTPEQQGDALRALGIESQSLIDALVEDGLNTSAATPPTDEGEGDEGDGGDEGDQG